MRNFAKMVEKYIELDGIELPDDNDCCPKKCPKNGLRCMLEKGHGEGESKRRCQFSPPSMLSPSSIEKLVGAVTSGSLKSLAGLDDEDVQKGHNNWKRVRKIAQVLCMVLHKPKTEEKSLLEQIKQAQVFTETSFKHHLKDTESILANA